MNVLLYQVDGSIPNLALMRLSAWHKAKGDVVFLNSCPSRPDKVYASSYHWNSYDGVRWHAEPDVLRSHDHPR